MVLGIGGSPLHPPWYKRVKSFMVRRPLGLIATFSSDDDTNPDLEWSYLSKNKLHWGHYSAPIMRQLDGWPYAEILPGGKLRHGEPWFNTLDAHEASEGVAVRTLGTGNIGKIDIILLLAVAVSIIVGIYIAYEQSVQMGTLQAQLDQMKRLLENLTAIFHG